MDLQASALSVTVPQFPFTMDMIIHILQEAGMMAQRFRTLSDLAQVLFSTPTFEDIR